MSKVTDERGVETLLQRRLATETDPAEQARLRAIEALWPVFRDFNLRFRTAEEQIGAAYGTLQSLLALTGKENWPLLTQMLERVVEEQGGDQSGD